MYYIWFKRIIVSSLCNFVNYLPYLLRFHCEITTRLRFHCFILIMHNYLNFFLLFFILLLFLTLWLVCLHSFLNHFLNSWKLMDSAFLTENTVEDVARHCCNVKWVWTSENHAKKVFQTSHQNHSSKTNPDLYVLSYALLALDKTEVSQVYPKFVKNWRDSVRISQKITWIFGFQCINQFWHCFFFEVLSSIHQKCLLLFMSRPRLKFYVSAYIGINGSSCCKIYVIIFDKLIHKFWPQNATLMLWAGVVEIPGWKFLQITKKVLPACRSYALYLRTNRYVNYWSRFLYGL